MIERRILRIGTHGGLTLLNSRRKYRRNGRFVLTAPTKAAD